LTISKLLTQRPTFLFVNHPHTTTTFTMSQPTTTKKFGKSTREVPHHSQKAQKWYPAEDDEKPKSVSHDVMQDTFHIDPWTRTGDGHSAPIACTPGDEMPQLGQHQLANLLGSRWTFCGKAWNWSTDTAHLQAQFDESEARYQWEDMEATAPDISFTQDMVSETLTNNSSIGSQVHPCLDSPYHPPARYRPHPSRRPIPRQASSPPQEPRAGCPACYRPLQGQRCSPTKSQLPICHRYILQGRTEGTRLQED
jgi:hypothetical protein